MSNSITKILREKISDMLAGQPKYQIEVVKIKKTHKMSCFKDPVEMQVLVRLEEALGDSRFLSSAV